MPSCVIPYQYYYPDDVVSARHFTDFAEGLYRSGWDVRVFTGNRYSREPGTITPYHEVHNGVEITRSWYPPFSQSKNIGRLLNTFCLSAAWGVRLLFVRTDVVVFGTNPQFLYYIIPFLAFFRPKLPIAIWGFDLYPEAIIADGMKLPKTLKNLLLWWAGVSYRRCGLLVNIGSCMYNRFFSYNPKAEHETIVPWALDEPEQIKKPDRTIRCELFGNAKLGILYSGTIGRFHQFEEFILLARELRKRNASISFCFAGRGNYYEQLKSMILPEDDNITFAGFADEKYLALRLASADIHMISLRHGWEGLAVPSKFFGSLASGRPLLYCGTSNSCVAQWIREYGIGFIVEKNTIESIADSLEELSYTHKHLYQMQEDAFLFYKMNFTKKLQCIKWDKTLRDFIKKN
jgi:glycosyltransferase involved in cell wall biosynthesis